MGHNGGGSRILVRHAASHRLLPLRDITRFEADEGLVRAHAGTAQYVVDYTLNEVEERTQGRFVRTSRAELVNVDRIEQIASNGDGSATLTLSDRFNRAGQPSPRRRGQADHRRVIVLGS